MHNMFTCQIVGVMSPCTHRGRLNRDHMVVWHLPAISVYYY